MFVQSLISHAHAQATNDVGSVRQYQEAIALCLLLAAPHLAEGFLLPLLSDFGAKRWACLEVYLVYMCKHLGPQGLHCNNTNAMQ